MSLFFILVLPIRLIAEPCPERSFEKQLSNFLDIAEHLEAGNIANLSYDKIPWVGRIVINDTDESTSWCTGALVTADTVLTARHCLHKGLPKYFCYQDKGLKCTEKSEIESEVKDFEKPGSAADFVFLKLKSKINLKKFPTIKILRESDLKERDIYIVGYHNSNINNGGEWPLMQKCKFTETLSEDEQKTDCYTRPGSSGGPIIVIEDNEILIIGVTSKYYWPIGKVIGLTGSRIVPAKAFGEQFEQLQSNAVNNK